MGAADLARKKCKPCEGGVAPLNDSEAAVLLGQIKGWQFNAVAWLAHREDHHPDMNVGYNRCRVDYATHAIGGLSENDFICAAKVDALFEL